MEYDVRCAVSLAMHEQNRNFAQTLAFAKEPRQVEHVVGQEALREVSLQKLL